MSIQSVTEAIEHCRAVVDDWPECMVEWSLAWREVDTRYAFIDPIINALGWKVCDPKQVVAECKRGEGWLDYALFDRNGISTIREGGAPIVAIEAKSLWGYGRYLLQEHESQLEYYVTAEPPMERGLAVLTNGAEWRIYDVAKPGEFSKKLVAAVDITQGSGDIAASELHHWLRKERWW